MDLKSFLEKAITDILDGIKAANKNSDYPIGLVRKIEDSKAIDFDIAVSAEDSQGENAGAGIKVLSFLDLGGGLESQQKNSSVSRIKFSVMVFPHKKADYSAGEYNDFV